MTARRHPFFTSARGRLLSFNLLMGVVTLLVSGVAVFGFHHASQLQEQVQRQTLNDMRGSIAAVHHRKINAECQNPFIFVIVINS